VKYTFFDEVGEKKYLSPFEFSKTERPSAGPVLLKYPTYLS
jgi:hypothetical protein